MSRRIAAPPSNRARLSVVGLASALVMALLSAVPGPTLAQDDATDPRRLEGSIWQLLAYRDEAGGLEKVPPGIVATALLFFEDLSGEGACSSYSTVYNLQKELLIIDSPSISLRTCDDEARSIDDAFYRNLGQTATWSNDGSVLEFQDVVGDPVMTFTKAIIPNDPTIAPWELARIAKVDGSSGPVIAGTSPRVQFLRGGRVVGTTGCGWFVGSYTTNDTLMGISDVAFSQDECTPELAAQASNIVATFDEVADFKVLPAGLTLTDDSGVTRMALVPSISLGRRTWTPIEILDAAGVPRVDPLRLALSSVRFANDEADGRTLCRSYRADSLRSGLALTVFDIDVDKASGRCRSHTRKSESQSQQRVEDITIEALESVASHALRGSELELMDAAGRPVMRLLPQPEFAGVQWVLTEMDVAPKRRRPNRLSPVLDARITAFFEEAVGVVAGETGKHGYFGSYRTPRASQIEIDGVEVDGLKCRGRRASRPKCVREARFIKLLESADVFIVSELGLSLHRGGRSVLRFERATADADEG